VIVGAELELADWRREVAELYATVRRTPAPREAHRLWRAGRDVLLARHPQSPLAAEDPLRVSGLRYWPYDPRLRFLLPVLPAEETRLRIATAPGESTGLRRLGRVELPPPLAGTLDVWWLEQYAGGVFLPLRDAEAGAESYGGGRYLLDSAKGADLGASGGRLVVDLNFLYHPSCRYDEAWQCPLAPAGNRLELPVRAGERL
jgi:uncharacterized protein (DUF1684 family)